MIRYALPLLLPAFHFCASAVPVTPASESFLLRSDVVYASPGGRDLLADIYIPRIAGEKPGVLLLHSGSWQRGSKKRMKAVAEDLARRGFVVVNANYRLAPASQYPAQLDDVRAAVVWMRSNAKGIGLDKKRIGLLGYSAGGHLALMTALTQNGKADSSVQAVVTAGAPTDLSMMLDVAPLHRFLGKSRAEDPDLYRKASPVEYAKAGSPPVLLIHGRYDMIVSRDHSIKLFDKLRAVGSPVEIFWMPHGHGRTTVGFNETEVTVAAEFLAKQLGFIPSGPLTSSFAYKSDSKIPFGKN